MISEQVTDGTEKVLVVGLTGQTGAGKTTVSALFAKHGFEVINADCVARQVVTPHSPCLLELCECFGNQILLPDGSMNRRRVAEIAFPDPCKKEILDSVMFPYITREILAEIQRFAAEGKRWILLDAPTLFESHADDFCQLVLSVLADAELRRTRIMERDGLTFEQAEHRMRAQLSEAYFQTHSDFVIYNNGEAEMLAAVTSEVIDKIREYRRLHDRFDI